jgi:uncharacterized protein
MKFGLSADQYQILSKLLIQPLRSKNVNLYIFGSRARGTQHPFSDIDILLVEPNDFRISASELSKIKEALEESSLTVKVDLVKIQDLAKSYVDRVDAEKVLIGD